ncbi:MAG: CHAD domain-containing protein [Actinobacteria bacterium]|nr:CHAD domain-containing protein [Actinomycetota bacterium]
MDVSLEPELSDPVFGVGPAAEASSGQGVRWSLGVEDRQQPAARVLALLLADNLQQFRSFESGVLSDLDTEQLHDYRVSLRRARSLLSSGRSVFPGAQRKELLVQQQVGCICRFGRSHRPSVGRSCQISGNAALVASGGVSAPDRRR